MRTRRVFRLLVVGPAQNFSPLFLPLGSRGYHFESVADIEAARTYLLRQPADVALLCLPAGEEECRAALDWLRSVKEELPVVVISCQAGMQPYLAAMECGAFDYFTSFTPLAEMERVLANAARWRQQQAA